jgi:ABC-type molybdate transport system permease subunit
MHLHQKVRRMLDIMWFGYRGRQRSNPLTTLVLLPFITAPVVTGTLLWDQPTAAWCALGAFMLAFSLAHPLTVRLAQKLRK